MRARFLWISVGAGVIGVGWSHQHAMQNRTRLEAETRRLMAAAPEVQTDLQTVRQNTLALAREVATGGLPTLAPGPSAADVAPAPASASASTSASAPQLPAALARSSPELRELRVRAFVSEQRLRFAATLKRLAFDARKLSEFDHILSECQETLFDESATEADRKQARQTRDARLKELFGPDYDQWVDANRNNPSHTMVTEIVRQTFQGSGALSTRQAEELTKIFGAHRVTAETAKAGQARYDWDAIIADADSVLDPHQKEDFATAIRFRRVSDQMSALSAPKK